MESSPVTWHRRLPWNGARVSLFESLAPLTFDFGMDHNSNILTGSPAVDSDWRRPLNPAK